MTAARLGLVLGAGGTVGMAYHAGVLKALKDVAGLDAADADLLVGTSAGSVVGAYLRNGWAVEDLWAMAEGTHPRHVPVSERRRQIFSPMWRTPGDLVRRGVGSAFVVARSVARFPLAPVPEALRRRFPGGFFAMAGGEARFAEDLREEWPERPLFVCAVDIESGRRVVFGRPGSPAVPLPRAVAASCAIPGLYRPVRVAGMTLVDGGIHSSTNLDLAAKHGCEVIVGVAPMAFEPASPPAGARRVVRGVATRAVANERRVARRLGAEVLLTRPTAAEIAVHGLNSMRPDAGPDVARVAYEGAARLLESDRFRVLRELTPR